MKTFILKSSTLVFAFTVSLVSCKKPDVNEVKVNDFSALTAEFKAPSAEYTTAPFFVWNYKITKEEIDHYLNEFKKEGSSQVFVHPRPGLVTEYLSEEWFDLFKYTVDKGKELGMKIWIYDENSYPKGAVREHQVCKGTWIGEHDQGHGIGKQRQAYRRTGQLFNGCYSPDGK